MATFTIGAVTATFNAVITGSSQDIGDLERFTCVALLPNAAEWADFAALVTSKYAVHVPLGGNVIVDVARGLGAGTLVVAGLGTTTALLVELRRNQYLPANRSMGNAVFLLTAAWA